MSVCEKIAILGAGGHAREVLDVVDAINDEQERLEVLGFVVDPTYGAAGTQVNGLPILGGFEWLETHGAEVKVACGLGYPQVRFRMAQRARRIGSRFVSLVHPRATLTKWVELGEGVVIAAGCILTNRIRLGDHAHINAGTTVGHDTQFEAFATTAPGVHLAGNVVLEQGVFVGVGASVVERIRIGRWSVVGSGATVTRDLPANCVAVGVPATAIKERADGWHLEVCP